MRVVNVVLERTEDQSERDHEIDCITTVNGRYYHNCLREVCDLLLSYDEDRKLTPSAKKLLDDLRKESSAYFVGVFHGEE